MIAHDLSHASSPNASPPPTAKKRTRRAHPKVRTGCITCKIRRKKCDEAKPECLRCTNTGRKCDGYPNVDVSNAVGADGFDFADTDTAEERTSEAASVSQMSRSSGSASSVSSTTSNTPVDASVLLAHTYFNNSQDRRLKPYFPAIDLIRAPSIFSSGYTITELEDQCFSYFRCHTGPQLGSYFESTLWHHYCTKVGLSHPVVFACAAALGAVHRRFNLGISAEAFQWCAHSNHLVRNARRLLTAFERDVKSQTHLLESGFSTPDSGFDMGSSGHGIEDNDIMMTAYMLLFLFETFQTEFPAAIFNLKVGIKYLLLRPMRLLQSKTSYPTIQHDPEVLIKLFERIKIRARELFGSNEKILVRGEDDQYESLPHIPAKFETLEHARDCIFTEVYWILRTPSCIWKDKNSRHIAQSLHVNRCLRWSAAYTETIRSMNRAEAEKRAGSLLKLARGLAYHLLYLALHMSAYLPEDTAPKQGEEIRANTTSEQTGTNDLFSEYRLLANHQPIRGDAIENEESRSNTSVLAAPCLWHAIDQRKDLISSLHVLKMWSDIIVDPNSPFQYTEHSISLDSAIGRSFDPLPSPKSSGKARFRVKYPVESPGDALEGIASISGQLGIYGLAEQLSSLEEHAVLEAVQSRLPHDTRLNWVDLTIFAEDRKVLLQYCASSSDFTDRDMRWLQEWWMF